MRRRALMVVAAALLVGAVGCGGGSDKDGASGTDSLEVLAAAQSKTVAAKSAEVRMTIVNDVGQATTITGVGAFDFTGNQGSLTMTIPNPQTATPMTIETVYTKTVLYLGSDLFTALAGKEWLKLDLEKFAGDVSKLGAQDPTSGLAFLGQTKSVKVVGEADVNGVDTTHYSASLDLDAALANLSGTLRKTAEQYRDLVGTGDIPVDVWIDGEGRVTRMMTKVPIKASAATGGKAGSTTTTTDYTNWGTTVKVTLPKPAEVADGTQLLSSFLGS